jgi:hypothetical protein
LGDFVRGIVVRYSMHQPNPAARSSIRALELKP